MITPTLALALVLALAVPATAEEPPRVDRLYLLAADTEALAWSTEADDPEASVATHVRTCGATNLGQPDASYCAGVPGGTGFTLWMDPAAILDEEVAWGAEDPLTFHISLRVVDAEAYTVHLVTRTGSETRESASATETGSGQWEGTLESQGSMPAGGVSFLGVRVKTSSRPIRLELGTAGASWVRLPEPVAARSVPQLLAADTYRVEPSSLITPERRFAFNDADWEVYSFAGDLAADRTFTLPPTGAAPIAIAWAEGFARPVLYEILRGEEDPRLNTDDGSLFLWLDGEPLGSGRRSVAALDVGAGTLSVEMNAGQFSRPRPYTVYVLLVHGVRTLRSMRWHWSQDAVSARSPVVQGCALPSEPIPATEEVTTFAVDLDWDWPGPNHQRWTIMHDVPGHSAVGCGQQGTGDRMRFVVAGKRLGYFSAVPAYDTLYAGIFDTAFEAEIRFTYTPPPCEDGSPPPCPDGIGG